MGSLPSRKKQLSAPPVAAGTTQPPQAGKGLAAASSVSIPGVHRPLPPAGARAVLSPSPSPQTPAVPWPSVTSPPAQGWPLSCGWGSSSASSLSKSLHQAGAPPQGAAHRVVSGKECHVPSSCVAKVRHRWLYKGISRQKAEELLLGPGNHSGSFMIRESQSRRGCFSLSVRHSEHGSWDSVTHYRIHHLENGWLYISPCLTFPSLHALVDHYSDLGEGLCCLLREPCSTQGGKGAPAPALPAVMNKPSLNWDKIDRYSLLLSEATAAAEDSPISLGLREAVSSYLLLTEAAPERGSPKKGMKTS
uniref:Src like adaptor 2 n=1 Tax=Athene cunicularia TaxID=194338 RepID=A0A663N1X1_ATHCN